MVEATNMYPNLNDQQQFRLNKINEIKDYFIAKIREEELINNKTYLIYRCFRLF